MTKLRRGQVYKHKDGCRCFRCAGVPWNRGKKIQSNTGRTHFKKGRGKLDLRGQDFGRLRVVNYAEDYVSPKGATASMFWCICSCGKETKKSGNSLRRGAVKSCGCYNDENRVKIGRANRGRKRDDMRGENNHNWRGDDVGYFALHAWLKRNFEKPKQCLLCGADKHRIEWANISGKYKRDRDDYITICRSCHFNFDRITIDERLLLIDKGGGDKL